MDAAMGFVGAVVIARWSWGLMQNTAAVLVDATVTGELEQEIRDAIEDRSEEHTSELQSLMRISYAVFCLKKKNTNKKQNENKKRHHNNTKKKETYITKHKENKK